LNEEDNGVSAAEVEVEASSSPFDFVDLDEGDAPRWDVASMECLVINGTDESSECSNRVSNKN